MSEEKVPFVVTSSSQIDNAEALQSGYGERSIRVRVNGKEVGFATTTYSGAQSPEMRAYSAERITLLMMLARGLSNDQIKHLIAKTRE